MTTEPTIDGIPVRGLTLHRPWNAAFDCGKDVENRKRPLRKLPLWLALHAGKGWDEEALRYFPYQDMPSVQHSTITHLALCDRCLVYDALLPESLKNNRWAFGPYCWMLKRVVKLPEPVPCKGSQGLWRLTPEVFERVRAQYEIARGTLR